MNDLLSLLPEELDLFVVEHGQPRYRADQILQALYRGGAERIADLRQLPAAFRNSLAAGGMSLAMGNELARAASDDGLTLKLLLELADETSVETVLMRYRRETRITRSSVCVSTQAGCAMGCTFCATGKMGLLRNLSAGEIVTQVLRFARLLRAEDAHVTHVTFMGMGEPLANYEQTVRAVRILTDPRGFGLGQRSVTVSTVGLIKPIDRLAKEGLQISLAISLHTADDELRRRLVPTAAPGSVKDLIGAARRYRAQTGRRVTFECALIRGVNDSPAQAKLLAAALKGTDAHVNLIPLNPTAGHFERPARAAVAGFRAALEGAGLNATVRSQKGTEIAAACGQLSTATGSSRRR